LVISIIAEESARISGSGDGKGERRQGERLGDVADVDGREQRILGIDRFVDGALAGHEPLFIGAAEIRFIVRRGFE